MRNLFWLCLSLLIITSLGCPMEPDPPELVYGEQGVILEDSAIEKVAFTWPDSILTGNHSKVVFEIIQLDSVIDVGQFKKRYFLSPVYEEEAQELGKFTLESGESFSLNPESSYAWRVVGKDENDKPVSLAQSTTFSVVDLDPLITAPKSPFGPDEVADFKPYLAVGGGIWLIDYSDDDITAVHTVNGRILFDLLNVNTAGAPGDDCSTPDASNNVLIGADLEIDVPCDEIPNLNLADPLYVYLFNSNSRQSNTATFDYDISNRSGTQTSVCTINIIPTDYLVSTINLNTCTATITVDVSFPIDPAVDLGTSNNYYFGVFLGTGSEHVEPSAFNLTNHGPYSQTTDMNLLDLTVLQGIVGSPDDAPTNHIQEHILLLEVPICSQ
ncbi:MAG: hypothetical protein AAFN93_15770 [Bacteroidota bacterium]